MTDFDNGWELDRMERQMRWQGRSNRLEMEFMDVFWVSDTHIGSGEAADHSIIPCLPMGESTHPWEGMV